jgi:hypothetical protein
MYYSEAVDIMEKRITALIPHEPCILKYTNAWQLWRLPGFHCKDLKPTTFQATIALFRAQEKWNA